MAEITLEKTHALLEKLAEYVMTQVPTRQEMNERFEQIDKRIEQMHKQINLIRTEQQIFTKTFELHHRRLELLEEESPAYRLRDGGAKNS